jgi:hypothetical protein
VAIRWQQDIQPNWESIIKILDGNHGLSRFAGQGGWNDADMLEGAAQAQADHVIVVLANARATILLLLRSFNRAPEWQERQDC